MDLSNRTILGMQTSSHALPTKSDIIFSAALGPSLLRQNRKRDYFSHFGFGNGTASVLAFVFLFHFRDSDFFFGNWKWNLSIFTDISFPGRQSLVRSSFSISLFMLKPSQIYLSNPNRWKHCNYFSIGSNKPEHDDRPTTPFSCFRFGNRPIQVPVLASFPKPKPRFYKRDKNPVFGFGNEVRKGLKSHRPENLRAF
jgi:hypothetical protein